MLGLWAGDRDLPLLEPTLAGTGDLIGPLLDRPLYLRKRRHGAEDAGTDAHLPAGLLGAAIDGRPLVAPPGGRDETTVPAGSTGATDVQPTQRLHRLHDGDRQRSAGHPRTIAIPTRRR